MADTDQHQPAAAAPGLSEDEILAEAESWKRWKSPETWGNTESGAHAWGWKAGHEHAKVELDAARADLARTRAEAAALRAAVQAELHIDEQEVRGLCSGMTKAKADWYVRESIRGKRLRKALAAPQSEQPPAAPVAPSAEPTHQSWCALGRFSYSHCTCGAITPPDHQAGDEHV